MLDRDLFRALKTLRDVQEWMQAFDSAPGDPEPEAKPVLLAEVLGPG